VDVQQYLLRFFLEVVHELEVDWDCSGLGRVRRASAHSLFNASCMLGISALGEEKET